MGIAGHVLEKMLEHYSQTRSKAKRSALEGSSARGYDTVMAQSEIEWAQENAEVVENVGGREGIRTPGLLVANEALSQLSYSPTSSREILANVGEGSHLRLIVCAIFVYMWAQLGVEKAAALRNLRVDKTLTLQKKEGAIRALVAYQLCD